jgi:KUP system potassium uptake protein
VFVRTKNYDLLAGVLLAVTGCEAMFAKYVHFALIDASESYFRSASGNSTPNLSEFVHHSSHFQNLNSCLQISFCTFVYPGLVLAYLGQGARLIVDKEAVLAQVFYNSIPGPVNGPLFWIMFVFAVLATVNENPSHQD